MRDDVSSLIAVGAPRKRFFDVFLITASVLLFIFYLGLHWGINNGEGSFLGLILFVASGILGILAAFLFPLDPGGEIVTLRGKMHLILVVTSGLLTIAGMMALWFRLASVEGWSTFTNYSLVSAIVSFILVIIAAIFMKGRYRGLVEKPMVTTFQLYYFTTNLEVFLTN